MAGTALTPAQQKKLDGVIGALNGTLKIKASDESAQKNLSRFADKYLRYKLGVRGTGPHAHGFSKEQRTTITGAVNDAFGIVPAPRKPRTPTAGKPAGKGKGKGKVRTTAQLAAEQTARAEETES